MNNLLKKAVLLILLSVSFNGFGRDMSTAQKEAISNFISLVTNRDWIGLSETISYPFRRQHPLEDIESKEEFFAIKNELFDDSLINMISNSHPDSNWYVIGSKGLRLMTGHIWLNNVGGLIGVKTVV